MDAMMDTPIKLTDNAVKKMVSVLSEENMQFLRFGLQGGGCSGFQYFFTLETEKEETDLTIELEPDKFLLIDSMSMMYVTDSVIDYKKDPMGEQFVFNNPNTTTKCGCGSSVGF